jgi:hypothetical protein
MQVKPLHLIWKKFAYWNESNTLHIDVSQQVLAAMCFHVKAIPLTPACSSIFARCRSWYNSSSLNVQTVQRAAQQVQLSL